jgi:hypothetical protein
MGFPFARARIQERSVVVEEKFALYDLASVALTNGWHLTSEEVA